MPSKYVGKDYCFMYPILKKGWYLKSYKNSDTLSNPLKSSFRELPAVETFYLSGCDGQTEEAALREQTKRLFPDAQLDAEVESFLDYLETPSEKPCPRITTFERQMELNQNPWPYSPLREQCIMSATFNLTTMCNHLCRYCFQGEGHWRDDRMPASMWMDALEQFCDMGLYDLTITGGEAALHPVFWDLMKAAGERELYITLQTNGALFSAEDVQRMARLGLSYVYFSLPSLNPATYDYVTRSKGDLPRAVNALREFKKQGIYARVKSVITSDNTSEDDIHSICELCRDIGVEELHFAPYALTYIGGNTMIPAKRDIERLGEYINSLRGIYEEYMLLAYPGYGLYKWSAGGKVSKCGCVKDSLTVMSDGTITFCQSLSMAGQFNFANIRDVKLHDLWYSDMLDEPDKPKNIDPRCKACDKFEICHTGCLLGSYLDSGNLWGMDPACFNSDSQLYKSPWDDDEKR